MMEPNCIKVLCADDHPLVRDAIAFALEPESDMKLVAQAENGLEALAAFRQHRPDVTLMDLLMPQMNGIDATASIRKEYPDARIIILTTFSGDMQATRALKLGAAGYLLKGVLQTDLIDIIRRVHAGQRCIQPEIAMEIAEHYSADELSQREIEILRIVAAGCSNKIVASKLFISENTVRGHMKSVFAKLQANDRTHAVMIAIKRGFLDASMCLQ
jgi:DNA-binding NarL/FixJ family response regulator